MLEDGVYLGLSEDVYFAQERLGSSDFKLLASKNPEAWWRGSRYNPNREPYETSDAMTFGKAVHSYVLDGMESFYKHFACSEFSDYRTADSKRWKADCEAKGITPVSKKDWAFVFEVGEILKNHPDMGGVFNGGMSEVSVLFTINGIKCRARIDKLLMRKSVDLKTYGNHRSGRNDVETCIRIVRDMYYDVQRALYDIARNEMRTFIKQGRIHNANFEEKEWLHELAKIDNYKWQWLFVKKPSNSASSPSATIVTPIERDAGDFTYDRGLARLERAMKNYHALVDRFGLDVPWSRIDPLTNPDDTLFLQVFGNEAELTEED